MIKKILPIILCLMLVFGISVSATNTQGDTPTENNQTTEEMPNRQERPQGGGRGNMGMPPGMTEQEQSTEEKTENKILTFVKTYSTPIISVVLLAFAFLFVIFYKRKSY